MRFGRLGLFGDAGELSLKGPALGGDLGEGVAELIPPLPVDIGVADRGVGAEFGDNVGLLAVQFLDLGSKGSGAGGGWVDGGEEFVFADPQALGVSGEPVFAGVVGGYGFAGVVAVDVADVAGLAVQAPAAQVADDVGAHPVGAPGGRVGVAVGAWPGALLRLADGGTGLELGSGCQGLVSGFGGPDPLGRRVDSSGHAAVFAGVLAPVVNHVPGVLGIAQDIADRAFGPRADRTPPVAGDRLRWRVAVGVAIEPVGDLVVGQLLCGAPGVGLGNHRPAHGVADEASLDLAFGGLGGDRVGLGDHEVPVGWFADVEALLGVRHQATPRALLHVQHVPLGDGLLDPPGQDRRGPFTGRPAAG